MKKLFLILMLFYSVSGIYSQTADEILQHYYDATGELKLFEYDVLVKKTVYKKIPTYEIFKTEGMYCRIMYYLGIDFGMFSNDMGFVFGKSGWDRMDESKEESYRAMSKFRGIVGDVREYRKELLDEKDNCYVIRIYKDENDLRKFNDYFFNKKTYYLQRVEATTYYVHPTTKADVSLNIVVDYGAYKSFNGIIQPTEFKTPGKKDVTQLTDIWFDASFDNEFFEPSDENKNNWINEKELNKMLPQKSVKGE